MKAFLVIGSVLILTLLMSFLVVSEAMQSDISPEHRNWELHTSRLPDHLLNQLSSMEVTLQPYSLGFRQGCVPFTHDLHEVSDFILQKLFKYTRTKSMALTHLYRVAGSFTSRPTFRLVTPSHSLSLVLMILSDYAIITHANKTTQVASGLMAFTPIHLHDCPTLIECNNFCYGYVSTISTLDHILFSR